jgi:hypothetical protein
MTKHVLVSPEHAVEVLNRALDADPSAIHDLFKRAVLCNNSIGDDPTIQVESLGTLSKLSFLGLLNGIFGVRTDGRGHITAVYDDEELVRFETTT